MQGAQASQGVHHGLRIVSQIQGMISIELILQVRPPLLQAHGVPGDAQRMGTHDWAVHVVRGAKDEPSYS